MRKVIEGAVALTVLVGAFGSYHLYIDSSIAGEAEKVIEHVDRKLLEEKLDRMERKLRELETKKRFTELTDWEAEQLRVLREDVRELRRELR